MDSIDQRLLALFDDIPTDALDLHVFFELAGGNTPDEQAVVLAAIDRLLKRGWLEERGSDFYSRTERGRKAVEALR